MRTWADLFTNRQLTALITFSDLVREARDASIADGAEPDYADAVATYLAFAVSRVADRNSTICTWDCQRPERESSQRIRAAGDSDDLGFRRGERLRRRQLATLLMQLEWVAECIRRAFLQRLAGDACQADAATSSISTTCSSQLIRHIMTTSDMQIFLTSFTLATAITDAIFTRICSARCSHRKTTNS